LTDSILSLRAERGLRHVVRFASLLGLGKCPFASDEWKKTATRRVAAKGEFERILLLPRAVVKRNALGEALSKGD